MATQFCPECHQPITDVVNGVRMPVFKVKLFRFIESHPGQSSGDLGKHFYPDDPLMRGPAQSIRSHIGQINDYLMDTRVRIRGGQWSGYYIDRGSSGPQC
jgi:hypothetical protein